MKTKKKNGTEIRVMHFCPAFFPTRGGIEVLVETMIPLLRSEHGIHSSVVAPRYHNERPDSFNHCGSPVYSIDVLNFLERKESAKVFASILSKVREAIEVEKPHIVHIHGFSPLSQVAAARARSFGIPQITHIHGVIDEDTPPLIARLFDQADYFISASDAIGASLGGFIREGKESHVIKNGIIVQDSIAPMPDDGRLIAIGRLEPAKGFEDAIKALGIIVKSHPRAFLTIIGIGAELYSLQKLARVTGVANNVAFLGAVPHHDVLQEIAKASIVIVPSRAIEGFSLVAAEAAMLGRPVVATRVGGLPETVIDGETGFIVPPESPEKIARAVVALLDNPETAHALAGNARSHAITSFDISRFVGEMANLYQQITGKREGSQ